MANYYHEARMHAKSVKNISEDSRRRAERRAEMATIHAEQPVNQLRVDGRSCRIKVNQEQYDAVESMQGMLPWNGQQDNMIDRFDGRALLDFYLEPPRSKPPKTDKERQLEELVAFEAYRDLVKLMQQGLTEEEGLHAAMLENVELRASAVSTAAAAAGLSLPATIQKGPAQYAAVGFSYGGAAESGSGESNSSSDEDESGEEEGEGVDEEDGAHASDAIAGGLGLTNFGVLLRRAEREEADLAAGRAQQRKRPLSRKKAAERARRMAGQGLISMVKVDAVPRGNALDRLPLRPAGRRSPSYEPHGPWRDRSGSRSRSHSGARSWSRSRSPARRRSERPRAQYITQFRSSEGHRHGHTSHTSGASKERGHGNAGPSTQWAEKAHVLDALPGAVDPAVDGGPVSLPASATTMQGVRAGALWGREEARRREEREREKEKLRDRERQVERSRAAAARPVNKEKETPMERLKRLRAAQLNKQFQRDAVTVAQKKLAEEKDRQARLQIERAALGSRRSPSPIRGYMPRSRSPSSGRDTSPAQRARHDNRSRW